jgi:predicted DNA-binding transcriptional regulator YafY
VANTSSRTLRLLSLLQARRYWPGAELADRLDVSLRTLRRDVDRLRQLGYPVESQRGLDGGYRLVAGAALPPLVVDDEEAVALAVGLHAAAQSAVDGMAEASVRALTKVVHVLPPPLRRQVEAVCEMTVPAGWGGTGATIDTRVLTAVAQACRDSERLDFCYVTRGGDLSTRRTEPHRLVSLGRRWYLVAYDLTRSDWRSFRLDRVREVRSIGLRFRPRALPASDAALFVRAGIDSAFAPTTYEITACVDASAASVLETVGRWGSAEDRGDGRCLLRMTVDDLDWAVFALGRLTADVEVLAPPELVEHTRNWARRLRAAAVASHCG